MSKKQKPTAPRPLPKQPAPRPASPGISDRALAIVLAVIGFALYANTLGHGYVLDDDLAIALHPNVQRGLAGIADIFTAPYREYCFGGCLYRPLTLSTFAVEWAIAPKSPFIGHLMNVVWYALTAGLLFLTLRKLMPGRAALVPLAAALLFVAHPLHTEVVANIKSRDEIMSLFFVLLSLHQFAKWHGNGNWRTLLGAGVAFLAALLSKEGAITALAVFPLVGWTFFQKSFAASLKNSAWALIPMVIFFLLRGAALSGLTEPATSVMDNPIVEAQGTERIGTALLVLFKYFGMLLAPIQLLSDYTYNVVPLQPIGHLWSLAGLALYGALAVFALYSLRKRSAIGFAAAAFLFSLVLYSQLPRVIGTLMAERLLYTPSFWFALGIAGTLALLFKADVESTGNFQWSQIKPTQRYLLLTCTGIALVFSVQTLLRNGDWASNFTLFEADVVKAPNSVRLNDGYAEELYKSTFNKELSADEINKRLKTSEQHSLKSLSIKPGVGAYNNLGNINFTRKNFAEAITLYKKSQEIVKTYEVAKRNIVYTLIVWAREEGEKNANPVRARELLTQALEYDDKNSDVWHLIGISYGVQGNHPEAVKAFEKAYALAPGNAAIKRDLSTAYQALGMNDKAAALK